MLDGQELLEVAAAMVQQLAMYEKPREVLLHLELVLHEDGKNISFLMHDPNSPDEDDHLDLVFELYESAQSDASETE